MATTLKRMAPSPQGAVPVPDSWRWGGGRRKWPVSELLLGPSAVSAPGLSHELATLPNKICIVPFLIRSSEISGHPTGSYAIFIFGAWTVRGPCRDLPIAGPSPRDEPPLWDQKTCSGEQGRQLWCPSSGLSSSVPTITWPTAGTPWLPGTWLWTLISYIPCYPKVLLARCWGVRSPLWAPW